MQADESTFINALKEKRQSYGVSQTRLAIMAGISREHLNRIEAGKVKLTEDMQDKLMEAVEKSSRRSHVPAVRLCAYPFPYAGYTARYQRYIEAQC